MTMKEILDRFQRGLSFPQGRIPLYESGDVLDHIDGIDMRKLDISEKHELRRQAEKTIHDFRQARKDADTKRVQEAAAAKDAKIAELEKKLLESTGQNFVAKREEKPE